MLCTAEFALQIILLYVRLALPYGKPLDMDYIVRVSPRNLINKKHKGYPNGYPLCLARKERLELSRRGLADLRP